ncbi:MAG: MoxR family ATPase [Sporichthyaceae bacterium]
MTSDVTTPSSAAPGSPAELADRLDAVGYLADEGLATAAYLALRMHRPLFCEGDAGVGKTALASALAQVLGADLIRLQCYEGLDAAQALYDWDFPRQLLHLRAAEAVGSGTEVADAERLEHEIYDRRFLVARPLLQALEAGPRAVLLVDEVDRADDEFEAFLLEVLSDWTISVPELGTLRAETPPVVILTSNRTREVHDALKRRCLYHWLPHPDIEREVAIIRRRLPEASEALARSVARVAARARDEDLLKAPGVAESLDWTEALLALGARSLAPGDLDKAAASLGAFVKYREDQDRVSQQLAEWAAAG